MGLVGYLRDGLPCYGAFVDGAICELSGAGKMPPDLKGVISGAPEELDNAAGLLRRARGLTRVESGAVRYLPAIPGPGKIGCLGLNYADHAAESGFEVPSYPALFLRAATSLTGAGLPLVRPRISETLDFEAELMVVIGSRCRDLPETGALDAVFGDTAFNDVSVREYQRRTTQWNSGRCRPCSATAAVDEVG